MTKYIWIFCALSIFVALGGYSCDDSTNASSDEKTLLDIPEHFPEIPAPAYNPVTLEKARLGRLLFYDKILSDNYEFSCGSCHEQSEGFAHRGYKVDRGANGEHELRNTMSLVNAAYFETLMWTGHVELIEQPAYRGIWLPSIFGADTNLINRRLAEHPHYPRLINEAFGEDAQANCDYAARAIATFIRTIVSGNSPYDRYLRGDEDALSESGKRGMDLFFGERGRCSLCHTGLFFTDDKFHNTATTTHYFDRGRHYVTKDYEDYGKFKTPTLRNIEVTGPYMHNGEFEDLEAVMRHYNRGGLDFITKDTLMKRLNLSASEKEDIINFLKALTDEKFLSDPRYSDPFKSGDPFENY